MSLTLRTPLIRLANLFPGRQVFAKCEFLSHSGSFKIRGANHLLTRLTQQGGKRELVVPSMGNTALGAAVGARSFGFSMIGVVPQTIAPAKDEKLRTLGVELIKIAGGGSELLELAKIIAGERGAYFVHPHLDPQWTDGYQSIAQEIIEDLPECRSLVFPLGGGGLLMGLTKYFESGGRPVKLFACEPFNYPKYARFDHARSTTAADGLILEVPHPMVQARIAEADVEVPLIAEADLRAATKDLFWKQGLMVEPSSAIAIPFVEQEETRLAEPICVVLTGGNITRVDFDRVVAGVV